MTAVEATADRRVLFGLPIDALTAQDVVARCRAALADRSRMLIGVVNAAKVVNTTRDPLLLRSVLESDVILADGQSVVWASRLLRRPLPERVAGIDLFESLLELAAVEGHSVYLLGARADVLQALQARLLERWPSLRVAGARDGYFAADEAAGVAADIRRAAPDMLFLGITSPKKELFLARFGPELGTPVLHGVGGSFDVLAGLTKRAPRIWQRLGLEWLYRVLQEPGRLWRRYLTTNTRFVWLTVRELVRPIPAHRT
jgi:N-acetylglucosaminyldiphosphoundecaprenol N-acetyl-beta-D-mannosaminyltransferase